MFVVVVAVEKWKALLAFQAQRLFHRQHSSQCRQRWVLILVAAGKHHPSDACQLIGDGHDHLVARARAARLCTH